MSNKKTGLGDCDAQARVANQDTKPASLRSAAPKSQASSPPAAEPNAVAGRPPRARGWRIIGATDKTAKRFLCACSRCGTLKTFGAQALAEREVGLCECSTTKGGPRQVQHSSVFGWAQAAARLEHSEARRRWKAGR